jgi:ribonucleoside-diphosphate reductase alpha chain
MNTVENSSAASDAAKPTSASCGDSSILFRQPADGLVEPGKPVLTIDDSRDERLPAFSRLTFRDRYLRPGESSPQQAFARAALAYADDIAHAQRLYHYLSQNWFMQVTPMLTNAPQRRRFGDVWSSSFKRECFDQILGMPISCYLSVVDTGTEQLIEHEGEAVRIVTQGGGIGGYWGATSSGGRAASGRMRRDETIPHLVVLDALMQASPQDDVRMAAYAAYLDINHPSIVEFLALRKASGGDANRKALYLHHGINISDDFMQLIETCEHNAQADDAWPLIDPITGETVEVVSARRLWARLLEIAMETGEPFLLWTDTANRALPTAQREAGMRIVQSNLCNEITLPTSTNRTGVATLSSVNLARYSEWKDEPLFIADLVRMLDNSLEFFINNAPPGLHKAVSDARRQRALGLGAMGFHSLVQNRGLAMSDEAVTELNREVFAHIKTRALAATHTLAIERGPCPDARGAQVRNMHLLAIAPNGSSSILVGGVSPGIEPYRANVFTHKTLSGSFVVKNPNLQTLLAERGLDHEDTWLNIAAHKGSVAHLSALSAREREIYRTALEIDQQVLVRLAADRQAYLCQSQSLNLFFPANTSVAHLHAVHMQAWRSGIKSRYYVRSENARSAEALSRHTCLNTCSYDQPLSTFSPGDIRQAKGYYKPFHYPWAFEAYKLQQQMHWAPEEAPLHEDVADWRFKLTDAERHLLTQLFRFFTTGDVDVGEAYARCFLPTFLNEEVRMMLQSFAAMEAVHVDAYSLLLETVGMPESEYQAFKQYRAMADKHDFLAQFAMNDERDIARNLAVYAAFTEGLQLFSSFVILLNFARAELPRGARMKGMTQIVSWSVRDESLHVHCMLRLFRTFIGERPHLWTCALRDDLQDIGHTMVKLEDAFIDLAFEQGGIEGLDAAATKRYIRFIADRRLEGLMLAPRWGVATNPLPFVDYLTTGPEHANFFETRPTEYAKAALTGSWSDVWGRHSH